VIILFSSDNQLRNTALLFDKIQSRINRIGRS
jgi:hypothetical protein